jgi:diguanylate cyclase (GGDEF)-like protein
VSALTVTNLEERALRKRRLFQFASLSAITFGVTTLVYAYQARWDIVLILGLATVAMLVCLWLNAHDHPNATTLIILYSATLAFFAIMWRSDGLNDSALLGYPVILMAAGQLLSTRRFWGLLTCMIACVLLLGLGTMAGWRIGATPGTDLDRLTDTLTFVLVAGFIIWFLAYDMQRAMLRLRAQILRYRESEKHLTYLAQHDALTQLPNRVLGSELMALAMATSSREGQRFALLFVDLDNFKDVNDSAGHDAGDEFLQQVARRLREAVRQSDIVCRQGGDEFLIGLAGIEDAEDVSRICTTILERMQAPFYLRGVEILTSCSIGIAMYPQDGRSVEDLLRHADLAMYYSKETGRNVYRFFDESLNASAQENLLLITGLRQALAQGEFVLYYQPVVALATGALVGAEALLRWKHPKQGLIPPGTFIPVAEKSGLITDIGAWVLEEACRQMQAWCAAGAPLQRMAVNLSPVQFRRGNVEDLVMRALQTSGLPAGKLELEVTESTLVQDVEKFTQTLDRFQQAGLHVAIDDFGTGYSNLSYLHRFSVHTLKVDQSFVRRLLQGERHVAMVSAIIQLARSLGLQVTAEGVEDDATRSLLTQLGADHAQGYWFAKPMPADEFEQYWRARM